MRASLVFASSKNVEGLAWTKDGSKLFATAGKNLYVYNPSTNQLNSVSSNLPGETEALEVLPDGTLIGAYNNGTKLFVYDVSTKTVITSRSISTSPYNDVESIAWPECLLAPAARTAATQPGVSASYDLLLTRERALAAAPRHL